MAVALPLLSFVLVFAALPGTAGIRSRLLSAALVWGVLVTLVTEGTSAAGFLTPHALTVAWGAVALIAGLAAVARRAQPPPASSRAAIPPPAVLVWLVPVAAIVLGTGLLAAFGWPSQWDSMVYHLPRIDHWVQNRSVAFYPTNVVRQLFNPPWSEYAALNLVATGGDERWANGVAWFSMLGSLIGVSLIAKHLGAGARGQIFSVLVCATIRMGILQAAGTQNDYVTAFWLVCMTEAVLAAAPSAPAVWSASRVGAALGLALLTKGTAVLFGGPLLAALWPWAERPRRAMVRDGVLIGLVVIALNGPHFARNCATFGSPLGPRSPGSATGFGDDNLVNQAMTPGVVVSNLVRNLSIHVGTGWRVLDVTVAALVERGHAALGLDASDPRTSRLYPETHYLIDGGAADPDRTGNPVHLALVLGTAGSLLATAGLRRRPRLSRYLLGLTLAFVAFSLVLKWQPWHSRLHLPWFVLAAPLVGLASERWGRWSVLAALAMSLLAVPPLLKNNLGPLVLRHTVFTTPRGRQYFHWFGQPSNARHPEYLAAAETLRTRSCTDIGLLLGWDDWEHPWWVFVSDEGRHVIRVRHVAVENASAGLASREPAFVPCGIIVGSRRVGERLYLEGASYRLVWAGAEWKIFARSSSRAAETVR